MLLGIGEVVLGLVGIGLALVMLMYAKRKMADANALLVSVEEKHKNIKREIENERKESLLKVKDEIYKRRSEFETEIKRDRLDLDRQQSKLNAKEDILEKKESQLDDLKREVQDKERKINRMSELMHSNEEKLKNLYSDLIAKLENISGLSKDQAKKELADILYAEVNLSNQKWIQKVEEEARQSAKEKSIQIVVSAMQRYTVDQVTPNASSVVHLPKEEMKGRIIGKEGRNIKSLEMSTGMEFVIGETPEIITISGFNPIRREIARRTVEKLILDGRINPTRIEETVAYYEQEMEETIHV